MFTLRTPVSILRSIPAVVEMARPGNIIIMMFGVAVGFIMAGDLSMIMEPRHMFRLTLAALSVVAIGAGANIQNDIVDLEIDRLNRPGRVLPSGRVSVPAAKRLALGLFVLGVTLAFGISLRHVGVASGCAVLLVFYNSKLSRRGLVGNVVVAVVTSLALLYGALVTGQVGDAWLGMMFAIMLTIPREIVKDIQDVAGDSTANALSLPIGVGVERSGRIVRLCVASTIVLLPVPYVVGESGLYLVGVLQVGIMLLGVLQMAVSVESSPAISRTLKYSMLVGLVSLVFGNIGAG